MIIYNRCILSAPFTFLGPAFFLLFLGVVGVGGGGGGGGGRCSTCIASYVVHHDVHQVKIRHAYNIY